MANRRGSRRLGTNALQSRLRRRVGSANPTSQVSQGLTSPWGREATRAGASTISEPLLRAGSPDAFRQPALERGFDAPPTPVFRVFPRLHPRRDQGHIVLHAAHGASGETLCRVSQLEIDALVACADMTRMCGLELARRVVRMRPEVRVPLMWHHLEPEEAHRAYERGYAVIEEPFTPQQLCRRLPGLLGFPHNDAGTETPLDSEVRLIQREDEVLAIGSTKEG